MQIVKDDAAPADWDKLAISVGAGYFHSRAEVEYTAAASGTQPLFLSAYDEEQACIGVAAGTIWYPTTWPLSRYGGQVTLLSLPSTANPSIDFRVTALRAIEAKLRATGVFSLRIASFDDHDSAEILSCLNYSLSERSEFLIDLTRNEEEIWAGFKGERRTDIRKAEKMGVETRHENTVEALELLASFQQLSMERREKTVPGGRHVDEARRNRLESGLVDIFVSYCDGNPTNAALFGFFNNRAYYHVSGSSELGYRCRGPAHLLWNAVKYFRDHRATRLNLGAALDGQTGLYRFKRDFGAEVGTAPEGRKRISSVGSALHKVKCLLRQ